MIQRLILLLLLTMPALAREIVFLKDGSRGIILREMGDTALVGLTRLFHSYAALDSPQATQVRLSELRRTNLEAEGLAVLIDPKPPTNLRSSPNGPVLRRLDGRSALILLKPGDWHQVMTDDGTIGYVHRSTVSILQLDYTQAEIDAVWQPLARHHRDRCNQLSNDGRRRMYCSVSFGPLGRVVVNTMGRLVLRQTWSQDLSQGFSQDREWLSIGTKPVNFKPPYLADYPDSQRLYHKVNGKYQLVLDTNFYSLELLHSRGVPDSVIRGLCLPYPRSR
ncbi:SH3 domain-containing protein [bacterium]|nr:SH3 domain-containing protein [bacterium]